MTKVLRINWWIEKFYHGRKAGIVLQLPYLAIILTVSTAWLVDHSQNRHKSGFILHELNRDNTILSIDQYSYPIALLQTSIWNDKVGAWINERAAMWKLPRSLNQTGLAEVFARQESTSFWIATTGSLYSDDVLPEHELSWYGRMAPGNG